jgi:hydroxymethylpyrimidine pyrophosphatase-like HAD family hydrolase
MRFHAVACDYDGTLADDGTVDEATIGTLERCRASGRRLILVTGRELAELARCFARLDVFNLVVGENGAVLYDPATSEVDTLADAPPSDFVRLLRERHVEPLAFGRVILATRQPHEVIVLQAIRDLGLELQVIFNKGAVMVLPSGVNKATGLKAALKKLGLSAHNAVAFGDGENDHSLLKTAAVGIAVSNAVPLLREQADYVTSKPASRGVCDMLDRLVVDDLAPLDDSLPRRRLLLANEDGRPLSIGPCGHTLLFAGRKGSPAADSATRFVAELIERRMQFCLATVGGASLVDPPEGVPVGPIEDALPLFDDPRQSAVIQLDEVPRDRRPAEMLGLWQKLAELRREKGRPHWILIDAADKILPAHRIDGATPIPRSLANGAWLTTDDPAKIAAPFVAAADVVVATRDESPEPAGMAPDDALSA